MSQYMYVCMHACVCASNIQHCRALGALDVPSVKDLTKNIVLKNTLDRDRDRDRDHDCDHDCDRDRKNDQHISQAH